MRRRSTPIAPDTVVAGRYRVEETLGQGGMGVVFAALDETENIRVALKLLDDAQLGDDKMVARFFREATAAAQVDSVHVARVFGHGRLEDGRPYIVSELLRGHDLARYLTRTNVPVDDVVDFVRQACRGLEAVHRAGIIHRDLKPANLYLALDGSGRQTVKILDFGICKLQDRASGQSLTREADVLGTPLYMPPEQLVSSRDVDARADIWSLGVILYEILTGRPPFVGASFTELTEAIVGREPPPIRALRPDVSPELAAVIDRCLAKHRADRFPSATALERALTFFTGDETETSVRIEEPRPPTMRLDDEPRPPTMKLEEPEPGVTPSTLKLASGGPEAGAVQAVRSARALVRGVGGEAPDAEKRASGVTSCTGPSRAAAWAPSSTPSRARTTARSPASRSSRSAPTSRARSASPCSRTKRASWAASGIRTWSASSTSSSSRGW